MATEIDTKTWALIRAVHTQYETEGNEHMLPALTKLARQAVYDTCCELQKILEADESR